jgi:hypothetical protein
MSAVKREVWGVRHGGRSFKVRGYNFNVVCLKRKRTRVSYVCTGGDLEGRVLQVQVICGEIHDMFPGAICRIFNKICPFGGQGSVDLVAKCGKSVVLPHFDTSQ